MSLVDIAPLYPNTQQTTLLSADLLNLYTLMRISMREHDHTGGNNGPLLSASAISWPLRAPDGSVSAPSLSWSGTDDDDSGWYRIGQNNIGLAMDGTKVWDITNTSFTLSQDLLFTDATYDIGKSGATRPRDGFFSRNVTIGGTLGITGTTTAAAINMSGVLTSTNATDATSINSGSIITDGGVGIEKALWVGGLANIAGVLTAQKTLSFSGSVASDTNRVAFGSLGDVGIAWQSTALLAGDAVNDLVLRVNTTGKAIRLGGDSTNTLWATLNSTGLTLVGTLTVSGAGIMGAFSGADVGATHTLRNYNTDNSNAASHAQTESRVGGGSAGDPTFAWIVTGVTEWAAGVDNSDSDKWKLGTSITMGTGTALTIDTSLNLTVHGAATFNGLISFAGAVAATTQRVSFGSLGDVGIAWQSTALLVGDAVNDLVLRVNTDNKAIRMGGDSTNTLWATLNNTGLTVVGAFGCNTKAAQTAYASGGALSAYAAGANGLDSGANMSALHALVVNIRAALVANGIMS